MAHTRRGQQKEVLSLWQGLGYNRRALYLMKTAHTVVHNFGGRLPKDQEILSTLPGIGAHTAGAILAYAHNVPTVFIETNIRSVFIHHFFKDKEAVRDEMLLPLVEKTLDRKNPRRWYSALMDYGTYIKKTYGNPNKRSKSHRLQSPFKGSRRELRGKIIKAVLREKEISVSQLAKQLGHTKTFTLEVVSDLESEGLLVRRNEALSV